MCPDPECSQPFIIVLPTTFILKHFRHKTQCKNIGLSEPESSTHLMMKHFVKTEADKCGFYVDYEEIVKNEWGKTKADVMIYFKDTLKESLNCVGIAVECQYSPISIKEYRRRNKIYLTNHLTPWWIFGGEKYNITTERRQMKEVELENIKNTGGSCFYINDDKLIYNIFDHDINTVRTGTNTFETIKMIDALFYMGGIKFTKEFNKTSLNLNQRCGFYYKNIFGFTSLLNIPEFRIKPLEHSGIKTGTYKETYENNAHVITFSSIYPLPNTMLKERPIIWLKKQLNHYDSGVKHHDISSDNIKITLRPYANIYKIKGKISWVYKTLLEEYCLV